MWHLDGNDKLKLFGFSIHGYVDGFSRKAIWLKVGTSNKKPEVIAHHYLENVKVLKYIPSILRSDKGSENVLIDVVQMALRSKHNDENAGNRSFRKGKSTANDRIEKYWKHLSLHTLDFYIDLFKLMQQKNILDTSKLVHVECLRFLFRRLIQNNLNRAMKEWNEHRIRKPTNLPSGIPNVMFHWPEKYGRCDSQKKVKMIHVQQFITKFTIKPALFESNIESLISKLVPDWKVPNTSQEEYDLFIRVTSMID